MYVGRLTLGELERLVPGRYAVDLETASGVITGMGLAGPQGCWYWDLRDESEATLGALAERLSVCEFVAHNVMFDGHVMKRAWGRWFNFTQCTFALYKMMATEGYTGQRWGLKAAQVDVLGWAESNEADLYRWLKDNGVAKHDMGLAPLEIIGPYCALDADACWQLSEVMTAAATPFPALLDFHRNKFLPLIRVCSDQQDRGMLVDRDGLDVYYDKLIKQAEGERARFLEHKEVAPWLDAYTSAQHTAHLTVHPGSKKLVTDPAFAFNPNSKQQLEWLMFDCLGNTVLTQTEGGRRSVNKKVLPFMGEPGKILNGYNKIVKEAGYVDSARSHLDSDSVLHPEFKTPGTLTGRLAGAGGINLQQQPKTQGYLECFKARPGHKLVQLDFSAVEPVVLAEHSQDAALMAIYGPDAKPNDIYLYTAANIEQLGKEIRKYYDPNNPTKEGIALAKKHCKHDRAVAKIVQLAKTYNAGAKKIHETLVMGGISISLPEVKLICDAFDELYSGVRRFKFSLEREWKNRGGFILNGIGRPITVAQMLTKDLTNRFCQSTGHDLLVYFINYVEEVKLERNVNMFAWLGDFHDESIYEVPEEQAEAAQGVMREALARLNAFIDPIIPIKGDAIVCATLADIKVEAA